MALGMKINLLTLFLGTRLKISLTSPFLSRPLWRMQWRWGEVVRVSSLWETVTNSLLKKKWELRISNIIGNGFGS
ncbi:hypothetical protein LguiA_019149 [Lonicera macranthoides]